MNDQETLKIIEKLLTSLPGIDIFETMIHSQEIFIDFRVKSLCSLGRITWAADKSNIPVNVEAFRFSGKYGEKFNPDENLQFIIRIPENKNIEDPPTKLQEFGIFLVRDLKALGLIKAEEANNLQKEWNAVII